MQAEQQSCPTKNQGDSLGTQFACKECTCVNCTCTNCQCGTQQSEPLKAQHGDALGKANELSTHTQHFELVVELRPPMLAQDKQWHPELIKTFIKEKCHYTGVSWGTMKTVPLVDSVQALQVMCVFDGNVTSQETVCEKLRADVWVQSVEIIALNKVK